MTKPKIAFAGDRGIAVDVLRFLLDQTVDVEALVLPSEDAATHASELKEVCTFLDSSRILRGSTFREERGRRLLSNLDLDYIVSIHFQGIYPREVLEIPAHGVLNLHPAYLPYNRGWHTPSWAIWEQTPYGATLHFVEEELDAGDIVAREKLDIRPNDTADSLYKRVLDLELDLFRRSWPHLETFDYGRTPQEDELATSHRKKDLAEIQEIDMDEEERPAILIRKLRALTTNKIEEAAYFECGEERYRVQVNIVPEREIE